MASLINNALLRSHCWGTSETRSSERRTASLQPFSAPKEPISHPRMVPKIDSALGPFVIFLIKSCQFIWVFLKQIPSHGLQKPAMLVRRRQVGSGIGTAENHQNFCQSGSLFERWQSLTLTSWLITWFQDIHWWGRSRDLTPCWYLGRGCAVWHTSQTDDWLSFFPFSNGFLQIYLSFPSELKENKSEQRQTPDPVNTFPTDEAFALLIPFCSGSFVTSFTPALISRDLEIHRKMQAV